MEEKTDKVVGYIEYLGAGGMIGEIVPYTSVEKFKDEILDSLDCGRPVTPVVFSDELDEPLQFDSDTYFPWGFRSEKRVQKRPHAWVYARIPGDYDGTMNSYKVCSMQALHDGCDIVGGSIDERGGWLLRPGYRDMLRQIKAGKVDRVYICRMRQVSGKERHLYSFFKRLMQHGVQVTAMEYSLRDRVNMFRLARRVERYATRKRRQLPW